MTVEDFDGINGIGINFTELDAVVAAVYDRRCKLPPETAGYTRKSPLPSPKKFR
jgi:hypothetical protein